MRKQRSHRSSSASLDEQTSCQPCQSLFANSGGFGRESCLPSIGGSTLICASAARCQDLDTPVQVIRRPDGLPHIALAEGPLAAAKWKDLRMDL